jgi:hypothetical protein
MFTSSPIGSPGGPLPTSYLVEELVPARGAAPQGWKWQVWGLRLPTAVSTLADVGQGCQAPLVPPVLCERGGEGGHPRTGQGRAGSTLGLMLTFRLCPALNSSSLACHGGKPNLVWVQFFLNLGTKRMRAAKLTPEIQLLRR